jgi:hypothetical protein
MEFACSQLVTSTKNQPEDRAMLLAHLPFPTRPPGISRFWIFWLGAATSFTLLCLLSGGQPHASTSRQEQFSHGDNPPLEQIFPQAFIYAPEVGLISEVQASGPYLRAVTAAWPIEAILVER